MDWLNRRKLIRAAARLDRLVAMLQSDAVQRSITQRVPWHNRETVYARIEAQVEAIDREIDFLARIFALQAGVEEAMQDIDPARTVPKPPQP
ncbi:MAG: hypothetical protein Q7S96_01210 [bacterium]|nr:hypothetical protein [bacterium]